jgi:hypothetical protein
MKKNLAFAQVCRSCRKSRPIEDFRNRPHYKINKTCRDCLDAKRAGREPDQAPPGLALYLPVVVSPALRKTRRWWPAWVHTADPAPRANPKGSDELRACDFCGAEYTSKQAQQRFCSKRCKSGFHRPKSGSHRPKQREGDTTAPAH